MIKYFTIEDLLKHYLQKKFHILSVGNPRDKTLRKLYLYTDADPKDIDVLITLLKKFNRTVAWTTEDNNSKAADIHKLISKLS